MALLCAAFLVAVTSGLTSFSTQIDNDAYDWMFRAYVRGGGEPRSILLTVDEATLLELGGQRRLRAFLAEALESLVAARPRVVAIDIALVDAEDETLDGRLEAALAQLPAYVLPSDEMPDGRTWQEPLARFRRHAKAVGHVHALPDPLDSVNRGLPLEVIVGRDRRWALALETFRLYSSAATVTESPEDIEVAGTVILAGRAEGRPMLIRYRPEGVPRISVLELKQKPELAERFRDRAVFVGVVAQNMARDRLMTPTSGSSQMPGVEIHAHAFETLAGGAFFGKAQMTAVVLACAVIVLGAGVSFWYLNGVRAYASAALLLAAAHAAPHLLFRGGVVFPVFAPLAAAWLSVAGAGVWKHFVVRRQLEKTEDDRARYQQAIHFVTHEMRTPLTAIQGSSEIMSRYNLSDEKRKQIAQTIHQESRRLGRMIQTFLDVERLTAGQMELKREPFEAGGLIDQCVERVRHLAERKRIVVEAAPPPAVTLTGDHELMEYALYNLLTNAIKYSGEDTRVEVRTQYGDGVCRITVTDQGIGMDASEVKQIFRKFYRTKSAVAAGIVGTGIGLSIVEQIVTAHEGRMEVESTPGKGSRFTMVLPARAAAGAAPDRMVVSQ
ncbi:MAG: CHASE2 domain-containing protein [Bryobacteraceae bacterium]|nr:CHASE2 domain-containing protein [Bryobacteraceae bacterium]